MYILPAIYSGDHSVQKIIVSILLLITETASDTKIISSIMSDWEGYQKYTINNLDNVPVVSTISLTGHLGIRWGNFSDQGTIHIAELERYMREYTCDKLFTFPTGSTVNVTNFCTIKEDGKIFSYWANWIKFPATCHPMRSVPRHVYSRITGNSQYRGPIFLHKLQHLKNGTTEIWGVDITYCPDALHALQHYKCIPMPGMN